MERQCYEGMERKGDLHWWNVGRVRIIQSVMDGFVPRRQDEPAELLEAGCGSGANLTMLSRFGRVTGGEWDRDTCENTRRKYPQFTIINHRVPDPLEARFDILCMFDVLEHIEDDKGAIGWAWEHLNPGGLLVLTVPAFGFLWTRHDDLHQHLRRYTVRGLRGVAGRRFEVLKISYFNFFLFPAVLLYRVLERFGRFKKDQTDIGYGGCLNAPLAWIFGSERRLLKRFNLPFGVSIIAVLRKQAETTHGTR